MISNEDYQRLLVKSKQLVEFFRASPLTGVELDMKRDKDPDAVSNCERFLADQLHL